MGTHEAVCQKMPNICIHSEQKVQYIYILYIYISLFLQACLKACTYIDPPEMICQGTTIAINVGNDEWAD